MSFLSPGFIWAFLSLVPLALIYLLKVRPRRKPTTAYFLWENIFHERRPNRLLQRLRDLWSLLLMLLAFAAICFALMRPELSDDDRKDVLLLIDNSASMNTVEGGVSRLDAAKSTAIRILRAFNGTQRAAVASVSRDVNYQSHLSDNPRELIDAVKSVEATDFELRPEQLASNDEHDSQAWLDDQRIVLLSDGCFDTRMLSSRIELLKIGEPKDNVGLVAADLRRLPGAADRLGLYVQVRSTHTKPVQADLLVYQGTDDENLFRLIPLEIQPGLNPPQVFDLAGAQAGAWRLRLDTNDALANDDVVQLAVAPSQPIRVQVSSENRFFFENSVLAFSGKAGLLELVTENADVTIHQGQWDGSDRGIVFQPRGESELWTNVGSEVAVVEPKGFVEDHPVTRHIDLATLSFAGAVNLTPPEGAQVIVASGSDVPLIYRVMKNGRSVIVVNLDPVDSEFYFSAWFPVLVHGAATHLAGREDRLLATYRPGDAMPILGTVGARGEALPTRVTLPDTTEAEITTKSFADTRQVGFFEFGNATHSWLAASSLVSSQESNIDNLDSVDSSKPIRRGWPLSHSLMVLAILILGLESVLYHRRKVG